MAGNILTAAFVGCSILFTSVTLLSHTCTAVISHVTGNDQTAVQIQADDDGQTSENGPDMLVPAFDDPGSLYRNLSPISNTHLPRIAVGIILSSNKFSKSGVEPFTINLQLANVTPHVLALSNVGPVKSLLASATNGPVIRITEQSIRGLIAQYRLEVCVLEKLASLVLGSEAVYQNWRGFTSLQPLHCSEYSAWVNNISTDQQDGWCEDLRNKLIVGLTYKVEILVDDWLNGLDNESIRIESLNRDTPFFEVID